jgi:16S rRNA (cytosine967-C5)-methyltransferase
VPSSDAPRLPEAVEARWREAWGEQVVHAARRQVAHRPPLDLTFASDLVSNDIAGVSLAPRHLRVDSGSVTELPGYDGGTWWVQDLAASLPARLIPRDAKAVLDLCAAPGGKTMQLAAAGHDVTALDQSESRLGRLRDNLRRTRLKANLMADDALRWIPKSRFNAILLDAPCSATGTFRRHPEVLYRARHSIIRESAELQTALLNRAAGWLEAEGALVYSVCSLEPEEGEAVIAEFLRGNGDFRIAPPRKGELPDFVTSSPEGWVRILPGLLGAEGGLDGFFMARLVRGG